MDNNTERTEAQALLVKYRSALRNLTAYADDLMSVYCEYPDEETGKIPDVDNTMEGIERSLSEAYTLLESDAIGQYVADEWTADLQMTLAAYYVAAARKEPNGWRTPIGETLTLEQALDRLDGAIEKRRQVAREATP